MLQIVLQGGEAGKFANIQQTMLQGGKSIWLCIGTNAFVCFKADVFAGPPQAIGAAMEEQLQLASGQLAS